MIHNDNHISQKWWLNVVYSTAQYAATRALLHCDYNLCFSSVTVPNCWTTCWSNLHFRTERESMTIGEILELQYSKTW